MTTATTPTAPAQPPEPRGRAISGRAFVVACVLAAVAFVAFLVFVSPILLDRTRAAAPPPAPQEVASGEIAGQRWTATAVEAAPEEPCLAVEAGAASARACTEPRGPSLRAVERLDAGGVPLVYGIVDARTTAVRLELSGGGTVEVEPAYVDFGFPLGFFAIPLPSGGRLEAVEALDRDGELRDRAACADGAADLDCTPAPG